MLAVCLCSKSVCAEGEETVVVEGWWWRGSICCALWAHDKLTPVKPPPSIPARLAENTQSHSDFQHVKQQYSVGRARVSDWAWAVIHKAALPSTPHHPTHTTTTTTPFPAAVGKHKHCFGTSKDRISSGVQVETSISKTGGETGRKGDFCSSQRPLSGEKMQHAPPPPSWHHDSHRAPQSDRK